MKGMNATTGKSIEGLDHLYQSVPRILTTPLGSCIKRRTFGAGITDMIDAPNNGAQLTRFYAAVATALMRWEPRLTVTRIQLSVDDASTATDELKNGQTIIDIEGYTSETGDVVAAKINLTTGTVS